MAHVIQIYEPYPASQFSFGSSAQSEMAELDERQATGLDLSMVVNGLRENLPARMRAQVSDLDH